jgi:alpha/beta superfamily hydrolase
MKPGTRREAIAGPAGSIECAIDEPLEGIEPEGVAILCHPHPQHGGSMDNKVVQTLARAFVQRGHRAVRFNFRGVGSSAGSWDQGRGEIDDALAVVAAWRLDDAPLALGGFSFGGYVASQVAAKLPVPADRLVLIAPAVRNFDVAPVPAGTLVVHGEHDDVVPLAAVLDWARPQSLPVTVIPGTGHFFHGQLTLLKNILLAACR